MSRPEGYGHIKATVSLVLKRRGKYATEGDTLVLTRVSLPYGGALDWDGIPKRPKVLEMSTGIKINEKHWDGKAKRVTRYHHNATSINSVLYQIQKEIYEKIDESIKFGFITPDAIADYIRGENDVNKQYKVSTLLEFGLYFLDNRKTTKRETSNKEFMTVLRDLEEFRKETNANLALASLKPGIATDFCTWLLQKKKNVNATAKKKITHYRILINAAIKAGYKVAPESLNFDIGKLHTEKQDIALSIEEINKIENLSLEANSRMDKVRDIFLLMCFTGLRYSDIMQLEIRHIHTNMKGQKYIQLTMQKTKREVRTLLIKKADLLLFKFQYQVPKYSNQKLNDYLKELGRLAGMYQEEKQTISRGVQKETNTYQRWQLLSTHVGRRTWATISYTRGVPLEAIRMCLGHSSIQQTEKYLRIKQHAFDDEVLQVWEDI